MLEIFLLFFVECHSGYFGKDCKNKCNVNCKVGGRCDKTTGQCEGGCIIGWTGNMCNESKTVYQ